MSRVGERDERLRSPEFQAAALEARAKAEGATLRMYAPELDVSGAKKSRAILDEVVAAIERGELGGIMVYNLKRLSRLKPLDRIELVERIEAAGGVIVSCSESFDPSTPEGRFQRDLFFAIARMEWEKSAEEFATAKSAAIERGAYIASLAPFGYRFDDDEEHPEFAPVDEPVHGLVAVEAERAIVAELFEARAAGRSRGEILELFEARTGRSSYAATIAGMLGNRAYLGESHYGRVTPLANLDAHEAIVSVELFDAVQAVERERSTGSGSGGKAKALLAGIATCKACGKNLVRTKTGSKRLYSYKCPQSARKCSARAFVDADELDAYVLESVLAWAGPRADELVELELELGAKAPRIVIEQRLAEARAVLAAYEADVERELRVGPEAYAAGTAARVELVERLEAELEAAGEASVVEVARTTLRRELEPGSAATTEELRRLLGLVLHGVVVRRTPRRGAPASERAVVGFRVPSPEAVEEDAPELVEELVDGLTVLTQAGAPLARS